LAKIHAIPRRPQWADSHLIVITPFFYRPQLAIQWHAICYTYISIKARKNLTRKSPDTDPFTRPWEGAPEFWNASYLLEI
jgi:hypothetical protein